MTMLYLIMVAVCFSYSLGEAARLTATPVNPACPGENMTFICHSTSSTEATVTNVRWRLTRGGVDVISQLTLNQGDSPLRDSNFNDHLITITLLSTFSIFNTTAIEQLNGLILECSLISDMIEQETLQIQIAQPPSTPNNLHIASVHNGSYSATIELLWSPVMVNYNAENATLYAISISSNGETWMSTATMTDGRKSITISYNTNYNLNITAKNCAGYSEIFDATDIIIVNCSVPIITRGVIVEPYSDTVEGAALTFNCGDGFSPNQRRTAICESNGRWNPKLSNVICKLNPHESIQDLNCTSEGLFYQRIEVLAAFMVSGFTVGIISCGLIFIVLLSIKKKHACRSNSKEEIELDKNIAYETITFPK